MPTTKNPRSLRKGVALILAMIFLAVFGAFAAAMASMSSSNLESSAQQQDVSNALTSAESGLECAKYLVSTATGMPTTWNNPVSTSDASLAWTAFCNYVTSQQIGGATVSSTATDIYVGSKTAPVSSYDNVSKTYVRFWLHFYRDLAVPGAVWVQVEGLDGAASRKIQMNMGMKRKGDVLKFALASKGRTWVTGNSTIHGNIYSGWSRSDISPFNMTSDSTVEGTINTMLPLAQVTGQNAWQMETRNAGGTVYKVDSDGHPVYELNAAGSPVLDDNGNMVRARAISSGTLVQGYQLDSAGAPVYQVDAMGNPVLDSNGDKIVKLVVVTPASAKPDEIQGSSYGINYAAPAATTVPGMNAADYDTTVYYDMTRTTSGGSGDIPATTSKVVEYYPHGVNADKTPNYSIVGPKGGLSVTRYIYQNQTYANVRLPASRNALFKNCTFNGVLFVDCTGSVATDAGTSKYNNVRFDNCTFNGTIVTNVPTLLFANWWIYDNLYFTGSATFQNNTSAEATILAPQFNVNLGNSNPVAGMNNVLKGAIVGGIVDVRGNAEVLGTIISTADTIAYSSGYVSNIGATLNDGGSETVAIGDVGTISITPAPDKMLPSGIKAPIVIDPNQTSYQEIL